VIVHDPLMLKKAARVGLMSVVVGPAPRTVRFVLLTMEIPGVVIVNVPAGIFTIASFCPAVSSIIFCESSGVAAVAVFSPVTSASHKSSTVRSDTIFDCL
jgi:hypothetical protein